MKRLLFILPSLAGGGAERVVSVLAPRLADCGLEVAVAVLRGGGVFEAALGDRVKLIDLGTGRVSRSAFAILRCVRDYSPDAVLVTHTHLNVLVGLLRPWLGRERRIFARESNLPSRVLPTMRAGAVLRALYGISYRRFDGILCQSEDMRRDLVDSFGIDPSRTAVINNPVAFPEPGAGGQPRTGGESRPLRLLAVGRLAPQKGMDSILRALSLLDSERFELRIVGEGGEEARLRELAKELGVEDRLRWEGFQADPFPYYREADIFILGSRFEGFPNALLEALSQGLPAAAFDCPGDVGSIVREGFNGYLAEAGDIAGLAKAIERCSTADFDRPAIARDAVSRFGAEEIARRYREFLEGRSAAGIKESAP